MSAAVNSPGLSNTASPAPSAMARAICSVWPVPLQKTIATLFIGNGSFLSSHRDRQPGNRRSVAVASQVNIGTLAKTRKARLGGSRVAVRFPVPFKGVVLSLVAHETNHILQRIAEKDTDFMGEGSPLCQPGRQMLQSGAEIFRLRVTNLGQVCANFRRFEN